MFHTTITDGVVTPGYTEDAPACVTAMDLQADREIATWSRGTLAASLLPPAHEPAALSAALARMGQALAGIYHQHPTSAQLKPLVRAIAGGVMQAANPGRTCVFADMPGNHTWVMPTIKPESAAGIALSAGHAFKTYYRLMKTQRHPPRPEELRMLVFDDLRSRIASSPHASAAAAVPARACASLAPTPAAPAQRVGDPT